MKTIALPLLLVAALTATSACSTLRGAAIGGAGGAGVAAVSDGDVEKGAAVGGAAGAVIGTVADRSAGPASPGGDAGPRLSPDRSR
jgi:osmotically inducible lipoprotein OsmB